MVRAKHDAKTRPTDPVSQIGSKELQRQLPSPARQPPKQAGKNTTPRNYYTQSATQAVPTCRPTN
jgi:hypothetical protein